MIVRGGGVVIVRGGGVVIVRGWCDSDREWCYKC